MLRLNEAPEQAEAEAPAGEDTEKIKIAAIILFALGAVAAVVGAILLPEKIFVQIISETKAPETEKLIFLVAAPIIVGLAGLMCFFGKNAKKWVAAESILAVLEIFCVVYNLIVL